MLDDAEISTDERDPSAWWSGAKWPGKRTTFRSHIGATWLRTTDTRALTTAGEGRADAKPFPPPKLALTGTTDGGRAAPEWATTCAG